MDFEFVGRHIRRHVVEALAGTRVVVLLRARQVGKSTLAEQIATHEHPAGILTLDDRASRAAAERDPTGFAADLETPVLIDEVQRVPDLLLAIKQRVDIDRRPGQFLLTGSADLLTASTIADALTGRAEYYRMWPFTQGEMRRVREPFIEMMFANERPRLADAPVGSRHAIPALLAGGYPDAHARGGRRRLRFFEGYIETIVQRDVTRNADALRKRPRVAPDGARAGSGAASRGGLAAPAGHGPTRDEGVCLDPRPAPGPGEGLDLSATVAPVKLAAHRPGVKRCLSLTDGGRRSAPRNAA